MADQSASRPKWIAAYDERKFESQGKEHTTAWSTTIFTDGPAVEKERFVEALVGMKFTPPLGGPYMSASAAGIEDTSTVEKLWDLLAEDKEKLTKHRMKTQLKEKFAKGEEGVTWAMFQAAFN